MMHLAVFAILLGSSYLLVRFGGLSGGYMVVGLVIFIIYLGVVVLLQKLRRKPEGKGTNEII